MKRTISLNYKYERVGLTEQETEEVMNDLLETNLNELERIINKVNKAKIPVGKKWDVIKTLFDKQGTASFTALNQALDDKVFRLKEESVESKLKPMNLKSVRGLGKKINPIGNSLVDKTFNKLTGKDVDQ